MIYKAGNLRGDKIQWKDGVGCTVWYPFSDEEDDEDAGLCFDFAASDIDSFIELLQTLKNAPAETVEDEE